ncbi:BRCA1-A complex subunit Abraxas 1-like [Bacillus rossius redtenbacheri]|uniref:BRCA1-A complex subunit Abraxas 1-like n=1 Tax=Bacillus rossius redtenbacheri TaxID=93214 RepID=UPI002FDD1F79
MAETVCVTVSGPALSFLLCESVKCPGNQVGLLLGAVMNHVTDTISDSHMNNETMETLINIHSVMPFFKPFPFYNGLGKIDRNKLKAFLKDREKEVVGWYCFRRAIPLAPYLRDRQLHKELCAAMTHLSPDVFTMCLLSSVVLKPAVGATHAFSHKFFRYCHGSFKPLSVSIQNLGGTSQSEYKMVPSIACASATFNNIVDSVRSSYRDSSPKDLMLRVQRALQDHLRNLLTDVEAVENDITDMEAQIASLRAHVGSVPNEILLPQLLKEEPLSTATIIDLQPVVNNEVNRTTTKPLCDNSGKLIMNQTELKIEPSYSVTPTKSKREPSPSSSYDPFSFTTEMKIDVGSTKSPVLVSGGKTLRGVGRGQRKKQAGGDVGGDRPEVLQTRRKPSRGQTSPSKETIIPISVEEISPSDHGKSSPPRRRSSPLQPSSPGKAPQSPPSSKKTARANREESTPGVKAAAAKGAKGGAPKRAEQVEETCNSVGKELSPRVVLIPVQLEGDCSRPRQRSVSTRTMAQVVSGAERQEQ